MCTSPNQNEQNEEKEEQHDDDDKDGTSNILFKEIDSWSNLYALREENGQRSEKDFQNIKQK
jgi:hypothetical protein